MKKQLANLYTLLGAVQAQPEKQFKLSSYCEEDNVCGTLFCTAGLASTLPHFQAQGMKLESYSSSWSGRTSYMVEINGVDVDDSEETDEMFGPNAWNNLFSTHGDGHRDEEFGTYCYDRSMTDKQLAIKRIEAQIAALS